MPPDAKGPIDPLEALGNLYDRPAAPPRPVPAPSHARAAPARMAPAGGRPTSMTVIGWLFVVGSVLTALSALMGLAGDRMITEGALPDVPPEAPPVIRFFVALMPFLGVLALVQLVVAGFVLYTAIAFLRRRAWARTALESMTWTSLVGSVALIAAWVYVWVAMTSGIPARPGALSPASLTLFGVVAAVFVGAVYVVPLAVIIGFLRGRTIRDAVAR